MRTSIDDDAPVSASRPAGVFARNATILFLSALTIMAGATISPALPAIETYFAGTPNATILTRLILTIPALFIAICAPLAGVLTDRYGRRPVAIAAILLYGLSGLSGIFLDTLTGMLMGRALLGVSVAGVMTVATALVGDNFTGSERDRFMGLQAAFMGFGGLFFLTGGGLLAAYHWRAPFLVYGVAFVLLPAIIFFIREPVRASIKPQEKAHSSAAPVLTLPLVTVLLAAVLNSVVFYLMPTQLPFHLKELGTTAPAIVGATMGGMTLASSIMAFFYGRIRRYLSSAAIFAVGFSAAAAGLGLVGLAGSLSVIIPAALLVGSGLGIVMPNLGATALSLASETNRGRVSGMLTACIFLGQFVSPLLSQPLIARDGYATAFGVGAASILIAAFVALAIAATRRTRQTA